MHKFGLKRQEEDARDYKLFDFVYPQAVVKLPKTVDLRPNCPPVIDQGHLNSCTGAAGCAALSMIKKQPASAYSILFQYYNERLLENEVGQDEGANIRDVGKAMVKYGVCLENDCPYIESKFAEKPSDQAYTDAKSNTIKTYSRLLNLTQIKTYLATSKMPVLIGIDIYESFESDYVNKTGKVPVPKKGEEFYGRHCVLCCGYIDGAIMGGNLICRNSWTETWGDHGYFYLPYEFFNKGLAFDYWTLSLV